MPEFVDAYRLVTFAPPEYAQRLAEKISALIPAREHYDHVAWWSAAGTEQFRPLPGADPASGKIGEITRAPSMRLEFSVPKDEVLLRHIIETGLLPNHPWEKPVILIFEHRLYT